MLMLATKGSIIPRLKEGIILNIKKTELKKEAIEGKLDIRKKAHTQTLLSRSKFTLVLLFVESNPRKIWQESKNLYV